MDLTKVFDVLFYDWINGFRFRGFVCRRADMVPPLNAERGNINENPGPFRKKNRTVNVSMFLLC